MSDGHWGSGRGIERDVNEEEMFDGFVVLEYQDLCKLRGNTLGSNLIPTLIPFLLIKFYFIHT